MSLPAQHHLGRLVGQDGRPVYMAVCSPRAGQYDLMRLIGQRDGRPVYAKVDCSWMISGSPAALPQGYYRMRLVGQNGRPVYVGICCSTEEGLGSSGSVAASGSIALPSGSVAESVSQGSLALGSSGSASASASGSEAFGSMISPPSGSGGSLIAGSGSGSGVRGTVLVRCCPNPLPEVLYATKTNVLSCTCLNGVIIPLFYFGNGIWFGASSDGSCSCGSISAQLLCDDNAGSWFFSIGCSSTSIRYAATTLNGSMTVSSCSPYFATATFSSGFGNSPAQVCSPEVNPTASFSIMA